jgi:transposase
MRSIVRRDTGEGYEEFLRRLAEESGIATPTREQLAKLDRKRAKKGSNDDWVNPHDPEAGITKMKDGRTHLAYKAEHAVDLETGAVVAVTVAPGDAGDTETMLETLPQAGENIAEVACATNHEETGERVHPEGPVAAVTDKGYHSNDTLVALTRKFGATSRNRIEDGVVGTTSRKRNRPCMAIGGGFRASTANSC